MHNQRKYQGKLGRGISSSKVHSIPIFCALALLLLGIICINPGCVKDLGLGLDFSNDGSVPLPL